MEFGYLIIKTDNSITVVESESEKFTLNELQQAADCDLIALVPQGYFMICCDDNAISRKKELNITATRLLGHAIFGDVVFGVNERYFGCSLEPDIYKMLYDDCLKNKELIGRLHLMNVERMKEKERTFFYSLCSLPAVPEDLPEDSEEEIYKVVTCESSAIAVFSDYSLAVGLIELIEEYCESKGLKNVFYNS